ncbi:predicted protein [Naegleria gruberi]|uniref:Predicted protein n=1 Tax=Naegleria gruberi TaxID=5762 RepID=D2VD61_NAEGR|nr:uncharacterized protein NAEGRDRAFT_48660 [Naegleria gruberi]EFC45177.1 predicted protein [Naegleria gruberi]|eukprot:XP_002677921.1 predicted protein [Naegleria gruberi strain NEG-M]
MSIFSPQNDNDEEFLIQDLIKAHLEGKSSQKTLEKFLNDPFYGMCDRIRRWIKQDESRGCSVASEEVINVDLLRKLDDNIKYDIMEFIPTFSKWKQFNLEREYLKRINFPKEIIHSNEYYLDSNLVTFHKMRLISKSFNRRMMIKILNIEEVFIDMELPNARELIEGFNILFAKQTKYVKENRILPDSTLYLYSDKTVPDPLEALKKSVKKVKKKASLFDDEDEDEMFPVGTSSSIFDDSSEDDFLPKASHSQKPIATTHYSSLFGDEEDDISDFSDFLKKNNQSTSPLASKNDVRAPFKNNRRSLSPRRVSPEVYSNFCYPTELRRPDTVSKPSSHSSFSLTQENSTITHLIISGRLPLDLFQFSNLRALTLLQSSTCEIPKTVKLFTISNERDLHGGSLSSLEMIKHLITKRCIGANGIQAMLKYGTKFGSLFSSSTQLMENILSETTDQSILDYLFVELGIPIELIDCRSKQPAYQYLVYLCNKVSFICSIPIPN